MKRMGLSGLLVLALVLGAGRPAPAASRPLEALPGELAAPAPAWPGGAMVIENAGQFQAPVRFYAYGTRHALWLADDALWLELAAPVEAAGGGRPESRPAGLFAPYETLPDNGQLAAAGGTDVVLLKLSFPGAAAAQLEPFGRLATAVHFYSGQDPAAWHSDVPAWRGVRYRGLYPGIDLEIAVEGQGLAWRLVGAAGQSPAWQDVRLRVEGAESARLAGGALHLHTAVGDLALPLPAAAGSVLADLSPAVRPEVGGAFDISAPFSLPALPAHLAPAAVQDSPGALLAGTFIGGEDMDGVEAIARGPDGALYVTGYTGSIDLYWPDMAPGLQPASPQGAHTGPIYVAKFRPDLGADSRVYMTFVGNEYQSQSTWITEVGADIVVDAAGNAYVAGQTVSVEFPATPGAFDTVLNDGRAENCPTGWLNRPCPDAFAAKLNAAGWLVYATYLGGAQLMVPGLGNLGGNDYGVSVGVDDAGYLYVFGETNSDDFPTTSGAFDREFSYIDIGLNTDIFVVKLNPAGNGPADLLYSTYVGSGFVNNAGGMAVDGAGVVYAVGEVWGRSDFVIEPKIDFPTTPNAYPKTSQCLAYECGDAFFFKLNPAGRGRADLLYGTLFGGTAGADAWMEIDGATGLALPGDGSVYLLGRTETPDFPTTPGAFMERPPLGTTSSSYAAFVSHLNPAGNGASDMMYSTYFGGNGTDNGQAIAVDPASGHVYVAGSTDSFMLPFTPGAFDTTLNGMEDVFVARLDARGQGRADLVYATYLGGSGLDWGHDLAIAPGGAVYVVGYTNSYNMPIPPGAYDSTPNAYGDGFVVELATAYASISGRVMDGAGQPVQGVQVLAGQHAAVSGADGAYVIGGLPPGVYSLTLPGGYLSTPTVRVVSVPPDASGQDFVVRHIEKQVMPAGYQGSLGLGELLTYTVRLVYPDARQVVFYDRVPTYTAFVEGSLSGPAGLAYEPGANAVQGPMDLAAGEMVSVTFAVRVGVVGSPGFAPVITNRACVYPAGQGLANCSWSNPVRSLTYAQAVFLPLVIR